MGEKYLDLALHNEAVTEQELLEPILKKLGFSFLPKQSIPGIRKEPDYLLFPNEGIKESIFAKSTEEQYSYSISVLEAKKVNHPLGSPSKKETPGKFPHQQIREYLEDAIDDRGKSYFDWSILTNGNKWRLYSRNVQSRSYFEFNFEKAITSKANFYFFIALFNPQAFVRNDDGKCQLDSIREESLQVQTKLENDLKVRIYTILEELVNGYYRWDENGITENDLDELYGNSLIFLYRLLFVLYCEGRGLLPAKPSGIGANKVYRERYSLVRLQSKVKNPELHFSNQLSDLYRELLALFSLVNGDKPNRNKVCGVPRYNGGLFSHRQYPKIDIWRNDEVALGRVLRGLIYSNLPDTVGKQITVDFGETIDYGDLEVRQLGSIYEGLLEHHLILDNGRLKLTSDKSERKATGTYYTPDYIVQYIVQNTLQPLCDRIEKYDQVKTARQNELQNNVFANEILKLNILDPAMGSGHFLVRATEFLADQIVFHPTTKLQIEDVRGGFSHEEAELAFWRRRVVESCIYGVDLNPLAVELAKLSLWLTCIAVDQPLSFLDHHFRPGNSLIGATIRQLGHLPEKKQTEQIPFAFGPDLQNAVQKAITALAEIEAIESRDVELVKSKEQRWKKEVLDTLKPYRLIADIWTSKYFGSDIQEADYHYLAKFLIGQPKPRTKAARDKKVVLTEFKPLIKSIAGSQYFHWELEFPEVFFDNEGHFSGEGGFDAVIGNPPYGGDFTKKEKTYIKRSFGSYKNRFDNYVYFIEKGIGLLNSAGNISYITPELWLRLDGCRNLRKLIFKKVGIKNILILGENVFKNVIVNTLVFNFENGVKINEIVIHEGKKEWSISLKDCIDSATLTIDYRITPEIKNIINDMRSKNVVPLSKLGDVIQGITAYDKYQGQDKFTIQTRAFHFDHKKDETCGKWLSGKNVGRYTINWGDEWLSYGPWLAAKRDPRYFRGDRIIFREVPGKNKRIQAAYVKDIFYHGHSITPFKKHNDINIDIKYLLGLVNSKLITWYGNLMLPNFGKEIFPKLNPQDIKLLPIKLIDKSNEDEKDIHDKIVEYVGLIMDLKKRLIETWSPPDKEALHKQIDDTDRKIDQIVYDLYGLTEDEIRLVGENE